MGHEYYQIYICDGCGRKHEDHSDVFVASNENNPCIDWLCVNKYFKSIETKEIFCSEKCLINYFKKNEKKIHHLKVVKRGYE